MQVSSSQFAFTYLGGVFCKFLKDFLSLALDGGDDGMNFKERVLFLGVGLDEEWFKVGIVFIIKEWSDGEETGSVAMYCEGDFSFDSVEFDVDEDGDWVFLNLFLLVYHLIYYLPLFF